MAGVEARDFDAPDETRSPEKTESRIVRLGGTAVARVKLEPGWSWSECIKPIVGTESCQILHVGVVQSGQMHVEHEDGTMEDLRPGHVYVIQPGHDASVVGDEPFIGYEFERRAAEEWAKS